MEQKRFLTADEVFQMFGVDASALEDLVNSGAVKSLADFGSFKYRREDFVALVKDGTLSPRTSGEMFETDSDGNIPFLSPKTDPSEAPVADEVSFLELDEEALSEQANPDAVRHSTPVVAENWFEDTEDTIADVVSSEDSMELNQFASKSNVDDGKTEPDFKIQAEVGALPDSDSDVRIVRLEPIVEHHESAIDSNFSNQTIHAEAAVSSFDVDVDGLHQSSASDSDVVLVHSPKEDSAVISSNSSDSDSDVRLSETGSSDVGVTGTESGSTDSEMISLMDDEESGIRLVASISDSGISLASDDSGISLASDDDSGIRLASDDDAISLSNTDSGISLASDDEIDISLSGDDSGISLSDAESGISLVGDADSGISLSGDDSGIRLGDSDLTFESDAFETNDRGVKDKQPSRDSAKSGKKEAKTVSEASDSSDTLDLSDEFLQDSGFDVSLAEEDDQTAELDVGRRPETTPGFPTTVVSKGTPNPKLNPTGPTLSETFQMDEPPEVEDLDISDDLEDASASDFSDEFAAVEDDEVFEASDADFSADDVSVAEEEYLSDEEVVVPAAKAKKGPKEPEWGLLAVGPIAFASLLMLATVTVLWGGVATMWTGAEAPGPAATLISTLAGLSPF